MNRFETRRSGNNKYDEPRHWTEGMMVSAIAIGIAMVSAIINTTSPDTGLAASWCRGTMVSLPTDADTVVMLIRW